MINLFWIIPLAIIGLGDALFLYYKKKRNEKPICLIGSNCNTVIRSKYAATLGMDNTLLGAAYYLLIMVALLGYYFIFPWGIVPTLVKIAASIAAVMSLYLVGIQLFVLKEFCDYCLLASAINILLAVFAYL